MNDLKCRYAFGKECQVAECKYEVCDLPLAYQQGRVDAIDECIKTIIDFCGGLPNGMYVNALKQLKEQN